MPDEKNERKSSSDSLLPYLELGGLSSPFSLAVLGWLSLRSSSGVGLSLLLRLVLFVLYGVTFSFTVTSLLLLAPWVETRYFPVVGKMQIERLEFEGLDTTAVFASFEKLRDCDYIGIAWFQGSRSGEFTRVGLQTRPKTADVSSPNRPVGRQSAGPWLVGMPLTEIRENSFVELYHYCTPLWVTTTEFYP